MTISKNTTIKLGAVLQTVTQTALACFQIEPVTCLSTETQSSNVYETRPRHTAHHDGTHKVEGFQRRETTLDPHEHVGWPHSTRLRRKLLCWEADVSRNTSNESWTLITSQNARLVKNIFLGTPPPPIQEKHSLSLSLLSQNKLKPPWFDI
jgi:hypothetical protein